MIYEYSGIIVVIFAGLAISGALDKIVDFIRAKLPRQK